MRQGGSRGGPQPGGRGGDGSAAWGRGAWACRAPQGTLLARVRREARRNALPARGPPGPRGPQPKKGPRGLALTAPGAEAKPQGQEGAGPWEGGGPQRVRVGPAGALGQTPGAPPRAVRGVLVVAPAGQGRPGACGRPALALAPAKLGAWWVLRWQVAGPWAAGRRPRGVAPQRQESPQAMARSTPAVCGLCALGGLRAYRRTAGTACGAQSTAGSRQEAGPCSDGLAGSRRARGAETSCNKSPVRDAQGICRAHDWEVRRAPLASPV